MNKIPDEQVIDQLGTNDEQLNNKVLKYLYKRMYNQVVQLVCKNSGSPSEADDVFQDGLLVFYKLVKREKFETTVNVEAYLYSICRNLWLKQIQKNKRTTQLTSSIYNLPVEDIEIKRFTDNEKSIILEKVIAMLGETCKMILTKFYYEKRSMKEIAEALGYANDQVAKNKKSTCMKKLKEIINNATDIKQRLK